MKKAIWIAGLCVLLLAAALWQLLPANGDALEELLENSLLPVPLCTPEAQALSQIRESLQYVPGFGGYALDNEEICIHFSGWPDVKDTYHVTRIDLFAPGYHVLGLQVGDSLETAQKTLEGQRYVWQSDWEGLFFCRGDVTVVLYEAQDVLTRINVLVETTNQEGLIF